MGSFHHQPLANNGYAKHLKNITSNLLVFSILQMSIYSNPFGVHAFNSHSHKHSSPLRREIDTPFLRNLNIPFSNPPKHGTLLSAKKRKNQRDLDTFNNWYDEVDNDATPDDVFWEEMERQKLSTNVPGIDASPKNDEFNVVSSLGQVASKSAGRGSKVGKREEIIEQKNTESVLNSFTYAMVDDNFLGDHDFLMYDDGEEVEYDVNDIDIDEENRLLEEQYEEMQGEINGADKKSKSAIVSSMVEPWDVWGQSEDDEDILKINDSGK